MKYADDRNTIPDEIKKRCLQKGCEHPSNCDVCGFDREVAAARKNLPLVRCEDGLRRKIIHKETDGNA